MTAFIILLTILLLILDLLSIFMSVCGVWLPFLNFFNNLEWFFWRKEEKKLNQINNKTITKR